MKVLILAGGLGTRLSEETEIKPKPMVQIGGKPILWHIMKIYSHYGYNEFVILLGYKGYIIKEYFANYFLHQSDVTINLADNSMQIHNNTSEPWTVTLLDTGDHSLTGGRVKRAQKFVGNEPFMLTYGDGVADININKLVEFHKSHKKAVTLTSVLPDNRFGSLQIGANDIVERFVEKPHGEGSYINCGFLVCEPKLFDYIDNDMITLEREPLETLALENELYAYKHTGFWKPMDTLRDKEYLNQLWDSNNAKWKIWE